MSSRKYISSGNKRFQPMSLCLARKNSLGKFRSLSATMSTYYARSDSPNREHIDQSNLNTSCKSLRHFGGHYLRIFFGLSQFLNERPLSTQGYQYLFGFANAFSEIWRPFIYIKAHGRVCCTLSCEDLILSFKRSLTSGRGGAVLTNAIFGCTAACPLIKVWFCKESKRSL